MMATIDIAGVSSDPMAVMAYLMGEDEFEYVATTQDPASRSVTMYVWDKLGPSGGTP